MRLDLVLNYLCLFKTRSQAGKACDSGRVWLNGEAARSAKAVRTGDTIRFRDPLMRHEQEIELLELPGKQVSKVKAKELYRVVETRKIDHWE